jgi:hypothetical protein
MARDFDSQLLESVSVRRRRLRDALLHGSLRARRSTDENLTRLFASMTLAAVLCAGSIGWSLVSHRLARQQPLGPVPAPTVVTSAVPPR